MNADVLEIADVSIRFGGVQALDGVSFSVAEGEVFGLIGPNGAGKTTLFNCISGLARPDHGVVRYRGRELNDVPVHRRSRLGIARTFQNLNLFSGLTVLDNLMIPVEVRQPRGFLADAVRAIRSTFGEEQAREQARALLHLVHLDGYAAMLAGELPVGLQRRVEIARALASRPDLLLLDEPASGLDPTETADLGALLPAIARRLALTVVLVDHDMALVMRVCDRICALDFGHTVTIGTPAAVRRNEQVVSAYLGHGVQRDEVTE